ncbi:MAG TPA: chemotaxis protein CheA [Candidatus Sulfopaludibacter sp.]|jgi:two-component system chemotaxis sensor kinase CheA|nr:chemotaxis protein CheA [Candidatus Sulfopaludibacter sp.]
MATKRKTVETTAIQDLSERVEELASNMVLGGMDGEMWAALLISLRHDSETAGRADVARIAVEALEALSKAGDAKGQETVLSSSIAHLQQVLALGGAEVASSDAAALSTTAPATLSLGEDKELIGDFILESRDHLTQVEIQIMTLEKEPENSEAINTVFRAFHTIKGLAGFLDMNDIREVAHETETLLDLARNQKLRITSAVADIVLAAADFLKVWLSRIEGSLAGRNTGPEPEKLALLDRIRRGALPEPDVAARVAVDEPPATTEAGFPERRTKATSEWTGPERRRSDGDGRAQGGETRSVKVDTAKLDFLVDMAGEMVIAQSMVLHHPELAVLRSPAVLRSLAQLARITGDLQKTAMSMRMVPIGGLFQKMSRLVRDLARKSGKLAEMEAIGGETELDRNVVEELADPLMHMVRNAADHGLEPPEERRAAGKDPTGRIRLRASHQAGYIVIEITDDGRGLIREKILEKARATGLVEDGASLSDSEVFNFIFHPGFSTAEKVTDVSGRGVGMDVVKKQIQKLRGRVDIESVPGKGSTFCLRLPLTLAMIDGLVVGVGRERYVLPIFSVREMLRPTAETVFTVENRQEMALVRDSLLPVVRLYRRFGVTPRSELATESLLIVAEAAGKSFCLMVDELIGKQEVVIKSLGETLRDIPGVAGGAILGDGRVGLILDLEGVFHARAK